MEKENPPIPEHNNFFGNRHLRLVIFILIFLIVVLAAFALGVRVGLHEERFARSWESNYPRNFGGTSVIMLNGSSIKPHGLYGVIISLDKNDKTMVVKDNNNTEKTVIIGNNTTLRNANGLINVQDLKVNNSIIIIGNANDDGQIVAKFIRVLN